MKPNRVALVNSLLAAAFVFIMMVMINVPAEEAAVWAVVVAVLAWPASDRPHPADRL